MSKRKSAYIDRLTGKRILTLWRDSDKTLKIVSQYTGAIEPATLRGLITQIKDLFR